MSNPGRPVSRLTKKTYGIKKWRSNSDRYKPKRFSGFVSKKQMNTILKTMKDNNNEKHV